MIGLKALQKYGWLYVFMLPAVAYYLIFHYYPMYGVILGFKDFIATKGIWGSPWVGFENFERFFHSYYFWSLIWNTVGINLYQLALFPVSIIAVFEGMMSFILLKYRKIYF